MSDEEATTLRDKGYRVEVLDLASDASWDLLLKDIDIIFNIAGSLNALPSNFAISIPGLGPRAGFLF